MLRQLKKVLDFEKMFAYKKNVHELENCWQIQKMPVLKEKNSWIQKLFVIFEKMFAFLPAFEAEGL